VQNYPIYLLGFLDPDFSPGVNDGPAKPIVPLAVYGGLTLVAGEWMPFYEVQLASGGLGTLPSPYSLMGAGVLGKPDLPIWGDPTARLGSLSNITDWCTGRTITTALLGQSGANIRYNNPPAGANPMWLEHEASLRDSDEDDIENALDTCPKDPNTGVDMDGDRLDAACDPNDNQQNDDQDGDGFVNALDNCPLDFNGGANQLDADIFMPVDNGPRSDQIGNACDNGQANLQGGGFLNLNALTANGQWYLDPLVAPFCIGGTDADGDGYCAASLDAGADSGGCGATMPPSCAVRHQPWSGGPLQIDTDGDGFSDFQETYLTTDGTRYCALNTGANNESGADNWPFDFNDDAAATILDVSKYAPVFGKAVNAPGASTRFDFTADGLITITDVSKFGAVFGTHCTPFVRS
jgi:hypothetical protein